MPQAVHERFRENLDTRLSEASYSADPVSSQIKGHVPRVRSIMIAPKNAVRSGLERSMTPYLRSADDSFGERIRHFPARQKLKSQRKKHARPYLLHFARAQRCDQRTYFPLGNSLEVMKINRAVPRHSVRLRQQNFGRNVANRRCNRCDGDFSEKLQRRISARSS